MFHTNLPQPHNLPCHSYSPPTHSLATLENCAPHPPTHPLTCHTGELCYDPLPTHSYSTPTHSLALENCAMIHYPPTHTPHPPTHLPHWKLCYDQYSPPTHSLATLENCAMIQSAMCMKLVSPVSRNSAMSCIIGGSHPSSSWWYSSVWSVDVCRAGCFS